MPQLKSCLRVISTLVLHRLERLLPCQWEQRVVRLYSIYLPPKLWLGFNVGTLIPLGGSMVIMDVMGRMLSIPCPSFTTLSSYMLEFQVGLMASFHTYLPRIFPYRMNGSMLGRQPFISPQPLLGFKQGCTLHFGWVAWQYSCSMTVGRL